MDAAVHRAYVVNYGSRTASVIDTQTDAVVATEPAGQNPYALALDPSNGRVYAATRGNQALIAVPLPPPLAR